jgi:hypothetical protein
MLGRVVITPRNATVSASNSLKLTANTQVNWSLAPGSEGTIDPDGTYHAPRSVAAKNSMGGCQVFPNDHIFNTRVDALPVDNNSAAWINLIPPSRVNYFAAWGINIADKSTPKRRMHFFYTPQNEGVFDLPEWPHLKQENGVFADTHSDIDRHIVIVNKDDCTFTEYYQAYPRGDNKQCSDCTAQSGVHYSGNTYELPHGSTDAAGLPLAALTLHLDEIESGAIHHALRVTLSNGLIQPGNVWPASSSAGAYGKIPYGTRFRLRANADISHYSPIARILLTQLKQYGFILADGGANWEVDVSTDVTESPAVQAAMAEVHDGPLISRDFEVVNEAPLMLSRGSGKIRPDNPYVKPDGYAVVIAESKTNPNDRAEIPVTLRPAVVGMPEPAIWIQSGVSKKLPAWVNGATSQGVQWKIEPALGTINGDGVYTAPEVTSPKTATIVASPNDDPGSQTGLLVTVLPKGPIRVDIGNATGAPGTPHEHMPDYGPDSKGNMWWHEMGEEYSWGVASDNWYGFAWPKIPDIGLYYTVRYSMGDMLFRFLVPNGNYKIHLMYGSPCHGIMDPKYEAPIHLESQYKLIAKYFDWGDAIGHACATPSNFDMPAAVADNSLEFALRRVTVRELVPNPAVNAFVVEPDTEAPHIAIDPVHIPEISSGHSVQFRAVGWFMDDSVTWSLEGPGTLSKTGLYAAPATPAAGTQKVMVVATSTVDRSKVARAEFSLTFGNLAISPPAATLGHGLEQKFAATLSGAPYQNVKWSISPAIGSIAPDGTYRAPETLPHDEDVSVIASSRDVEGKTGTAKIHVKALSDPIRINCGDQGGFRDAQGNEWTGDWGGSPATAYHVDNIPIKNAGPDMQYLYRSSRYRYPNESFFYNFMLPNGQYNVILMFADTAHDTPDTNNFFDVKLNGKQVLSHFNPSAIAGPKTALNKEFQVSITNHNLRIDFIGERRRCVCKRHTNPPDTCREIVLLNGRDK